jgi:hypothetical protein
MIAVVTNLLCLWEVNRTLGISPSLSKYRGLMVPTALTIACILLVRHLAATPWPHWWVIGATLIVSYMVFVASALMFLDDDDREIAEAIRYRIRALAGKAQ